MTILERNYGLDLLETNRVDATKYTGSRKMEKIRFSKDPQGKVAILVPIVAIKIDVSRSEENTGIRI